MSYLLYHFYYIKKVLFICTISFFILILSSLCFLYSTAVTISSMGFDFCWNHYPGERRKPFSEAQNIKFKKYGANYKASIKSKFPHFAVKSRAVRSNGVEVDHLHSGTMLPMLHHAGTHTCSFYIYVYDWVSLMWILILLTVADRWNRRRRAVINGIAPCATRNNQSRKFSLRDLWLKTFGSLFRALICPENLSTNNLCTSKP